MSFAGQDLWEQNQTRNFANIHLWLDLQSTPDNDLVSAKRLINIEMISVTNLLSIFLDKSTTKKIFWCFENLGHTWHHEWYHCDTTSD